MQRRTFLLQLRFDDFLCIVPGAARVGHEDRLEQAEQRNRDQVADEEVRLEESERQRGKEHGQEDVKHALLRILGADFDHLLRIRDGSLGGAFELDVRLNELHRAVGARGDGLGRCAGEPVNHRAAGDQAEQERRIKNGKKPQQVRF